MGKSSPRKHRGRVKPARRNASVQSALGHGKQVPFEKRQQRFRERLPVSRLMDLGLTYKEAKEAVRGGSDTIGYRLIERDRVAKRKKKKTR